MTVPLPAYDDTDWMDWAQQLDTQGRAGALAEHLVHPLGRVLGLRTPGQRTPAVAAPIVTMPTAVPTLTFHPACLGTAAAEGRAARLNPEFRFIGGPYQRAYPSSPWQEAVRERPRPAFNTGSGSVVVEFWSDAPMIQFYMFTNDLGYTRVSANDVEVMHVGPAMNTGTATGGGASSITLSTAVAPIASAANHAYLDAWVRIVSGTGAGQRRQITGYVGATKVATVGQPWTTVPDTTSVYHVTIGPFDGASIASTQYPTLDWGGERRWRRYRVEADGTYFRGVYVGLSDSVIAGPPSLGAPACFASDSYGFGTGGEGTVIDSSSQQACRQLGWTLIPEGCIPGTGYLNTGSGGSGTIRDRLLPPTNSWVIHLSATAGTYTLTWNGITTGAIAYNAAYTTVQAAIDAAFGANAWQVCANGGGFNHVVLLGRGVNANSSTPMTADFTNLTGGWKQIERWTGTVLPHIPRDGNNAPLPFWIVLAAGGNDRPALNAAYTPSALYAEVRQLILDLGLAYPTGRVVVVNAHDAPNRGGGVTIAYADTINAGRAIRQACQEVLPRLKGVLPLVEPIVENAGGTLTAAPAAGATTITVSAGRYEVGSVVAIDAGSLTETRTVTAVAGSGPYTLTVAALTNAHAIGATVVPISTWIAGAGYLTAPTGTAPPIGSGASPSDRLISSDSVHPTPLGSMLVGTRIALEIDRILTRQPAAVGG